MKTKKIVAIVLSLVLVLTMAVGCSKPAAPKEEQKTKFPEKAIDMTILFGAGSASDIVARKLGEIVAKDLGQPVVANNRVGGGGAVGYQHVLGSKADGYSIVWNSTSISTTYHLGNMPKDKGYDAFNGVANITLESAALAVNPKSEWKTIEDFIAYAKANPGKVTVANSGVGSFNHLVAAALEDAAGIEVKHIPMDAKQSTTALLGGKVDAMVNMTFDIVQQEKAGQVRTLAVVSEKRHTLLPDVPTLKEKGIDVTLMMYRGMAVPKGTPEDVIKVLETSFLKAADSAEFKEFAQKYGVEVKPMGVAEFDKFMAEQDKTVAALMDKLGIKKQ